MEKGFDNEIFLKLQSEKILERIKKFNNKLYLEFGGKLFDDLHASRVLPGYNPNVKIKLLENLKDKLEIIFCINAADIEKNKIRADFGITYDMEVLRLMENLRVLGLKINSVVITLFEGQAAAKTFATKLERRNVKVYFHAKTKGYPADISTIVSDGGYGANPYIKTTMPLVVVTAPGPSSGKLGTCLSQLYHEHKRGVFSGYAKFETFPVWDLPLKHLINAAYEASTADLKDVNTIDPFHLNAYGEIAVNYNRDIEVFPVLREILYKITGRRDVYQSPTDMGVNAIRFAITNEDSVNLACRQEIVRRFYRESVAYKKGERSADVPERIQLLMNEHNINTSERKCVKAALEKEKATGSPTIAIEIADGTIITGRTKDIITAADSVVLNALKHLAELEDDLKLISPSILEPILNYKRDILGYKNAVLNLKDVLLALSVGLKDNALIKAVYDKLPLLRGLEAHATYILNPSDEDTFRRLGINLTCEPVYLSDNLFEI